MKHQNNQLNDIAYEDALTSIPNRRRFNEFFNQEWARQKRIDKPLSVLIIDIDCFKNYNDFYGHQLGDVCLCEVAMMLTSIVNRDTDLVARYGGEEFVAVLPNTDRLGVIMLADRVRQAIQDLRIEHRTSHVDNLDVVSVSIGVATTKTEHNYESSDDLLEHADIALYKAKELGRNQVIHFDM